MPRRLSDNARNAVKAQTNAASFALMMHQLTMGAIENEQRSLANVLFVLYVTAMQLRDATITLQKFYKEVPLEPGDNKDQALLLLDRLLAIADIDQTGEHVEDRRFYDALMQVKNKLTGIDGSKDQVMVQ